MYLNCPLIELLKFPSNSVGRERANCIKKINLGENKQALVKLVTCERCAEKLLYKKMKEKEQLRKREKEELLKKRERSESGDGTDTGYGRSKKRKKERVASTSASDHKSKSDDDENFDEFLEGMFP
ncbi:hypothetical protein HYC85_016863 [Camellia sinensis]|uniref:Uncharacterized protein n=1 Tax=Camellia sinensis TaxID=4442 RepID=A0A7J7H245_CAMSI|nr:hypothetical protein HYC85_016863 [Camellia sinensis]